MAFWEVVVLRRRCFDREEPFLRLWNKIFLFLSMFAASLDFLFLYAFGIDNHRKCLWLDVCLERMVVILRSIVDLFLTLRVVFRLRTRVPVSTKLIFRSDILSILPLPQVAVLLIIPKVEGGRELDPNELVHKLLQLMVALQALPRFLRGSELYNETFRRSKNQLIYALGFLLILIWGGHAIGGFWYLFSIRRLMYCWQSACARNASCNSETLYCSKYFRNEAYTKGRSFLDNACSADSEGRPPFDFGIFINAVNSGVLESTSLSSKLFYCFWWALQNLSNLGQNLKTSTYPLEISLALWLFMGGGVLFVQFIGIIQATMSSSLAREEEMMKWQDVVRWMDSNNFPPSLKKRVKRHEQYKWRKTKGLDVENLLNNFPKPLRSDVKRHLSWNLLLKVPVFEQMDAKLLDALCDCIKPINCEAESYIVREGDPVDKMLFIMQGEILTVTTNGGRTSSNHLKAGDFCGEELLTWPLDPDSPSSLQSSTRTVQTLTEVEGFVIVADDLKYALSQFCQLHREQLRHKLRFYSQQWRTWAACIIQAAWRRYVKRKLEKNLLEEENRLRDALAETSRNSPALGAMIYITRFATNALRVRQNTGAHDARLMESIQPMLLQKPAEPDFASEQV